MSESKPPVNPVAPSSGAAPTVSIVATGSYVPERVLTNADLEKMVDTSDEWIFTRSGIRERRIAAEGEATSDMAAAAAQRALDSIGMRGEEVDLILVATCTPDMIFPSTACYVQQQIGARRAACLDVSAACSGFLYAMDIGRQYILTGSAKTVLIIGAEKMSAIVDWTDRGTCVLFGDGAGAAILQARGATHGILPSVLGSDGELSELLTLPGGGSRNPASQEVLDGRLCYVKMAGREVFKHAVTHMANAATQILERYGMTIDDVACIIPHQANARIIQAIAQRIGAPMEKIYMNVDRYGNTSAASVIMAMDEASRTGRIRQGDMVLLVVFGSGFTWAASLVEW